VEEDKLKVLLVRLAQEEMVVVEQEQLQETVLVLQEQLTRVEVEVEKDYRHQDLEVEPEVQESLLLEHLAEYQQLHQELIL
jgi:hypothetical protein